MPELNDVEIARRKLERCCKGKTITSVSTQPDALVFTVDTTKFEKKLTNRKVLQVRRKGKYLWLELDKPPFPTFHFGMTGKFEVKPKEDKEKFKWPPEYWKCTLTLNTGIELAYTNVRRLGRIGLYKDPLKEGPISKLGDDPLFNMPSLEKFRDRLSMHKAEIKALLLDQTFLAGVGNWIADEVLYQAHIHPKVLANQISPAESLKLYEKIKYIVTTSVELDDKEESYPVDWLVHYRWTKAKKSIIPTMPDGNTIEFVKSGGRTSAIVPVVQKLGKDSANNKDEAPTKRKTLKRKTSDSEKVYQDDNAFEKPSKTKKRRVKKKQSKK